MFYHTFADDPIELEEREEVLLSNNEKLLYSKSHISSSSHTSTFHEQYHKFKQIQQQRKKHRNLIEVSLYPPGKIIHLIKTGETHSFCSYCNCLYKCCTCGTSNFGSIYTPIYV